MHIYADVASLCAVNVWNHSRIHTHWPIDFHTWAQSPPTSARGETWRGSDLFSLVPRREALNPWPSLGKYIHQARSTHSLNQNSRGAIELSFQFQVCFIYHRLKRISKFQKRTFSRGLLLSDWTNIPVFYTNFPGVQVIMWFIVMTDNNHQYFLWRWKCFTTFFFISSKLSLLYFILTLTEVFHCDRTERLWPAKDIQKEMFSYAAAKLLALCLKTFSWKWPIVCSWWKGIFTNGLHASNKARHCSLNCHFCAHSTADNSQN